MRSNTKLILTLINRIARQLPNHSGRSLENLEQDPIVQQTGISQLDINQKKNKGLKNNIL
ncbi:uncharacterized protein BYT42DRAFT_560820, partial [Radiomyces spectabilis]|uniref:uncharacterized protein n=1 Tax=Radiomyces spectabilis TaxID=64574 RepID=UPI002220849C